MTYLLLRVTGGYWEPAEETIVGECETHEEAVEAVRDSARRGGRLTFRCCHDDPADIDPTPSTPDTSYLEVRHPNGSHR